MNLGPRFYSSKLGKVTLAVLALCLTLGMIIGIALATHSTLHSETLVVNSTSSTGTNTTTTLEAGVLYEAVVTGVWTYASGLGYYADAECTVTPGVGALWTREGYAENAGDLMINKAAVEWIPVVPDAGGCSSVQHEYRTYFTPNSRGPVNFSIFDTLYGDNSGSLTVKVTRVSSVLMSGVGVHIENIVVDSSNSNGNWAKNGLKDPGNYTLLASGQYMFATAAGTDFRADAECSSYVGDQTTWERNRYGTGAADSLDLLVNGVEVSWNTVRGGACDALTNLYSTIYTPGTKNLSLRVNESGGGFSDNEGYLFVEVFSASVIPTLNPVPTPSVSPIPTPNPTLTPAPNPTVPPTPNPTLPPTPNPTVPPTPNPTMPPTPNPTVPPVPNVTPSPGCYGYGVVVCTPTVPPTPSPTVPPLPNPDPEALRLVDTVTVPSTGANASSVALSNAKSYLFVPSGVWVWDNRFAGALADAQCQTTGQLPQYPGEPTWDRYSLSDPWGDIVLGQTRRLLVDDEVVEWVPQTPTIYACDEKDHVYNSLRLRSSSSGTSTARFRIDDDIYSDNAGSLTVRIYELVSLTSSTSLGSPDKWLET